MKKKILIGSIIAVVILVLVSFTSVVGYNSVKSDSKIASPLFGIRTNRAINKEQNAVTSHYIGKGKAINILLHKRNDKAEWVENFANLVKRMDEKSLDIVADIYINELESNENIDHIDSNYIRDAIYFISKNPEISKSFLLQEKEKSDSNDYTYGNPTRIGCIFSLIIEAFIYMILGILFILGTPFRILAFIFGFTIDPYCCGFLETLNM